MRLGGLPLGLAHDVKLLRPVKKGQSLSWADVAMDESATGAEVAPRDGAAQFAPAEEDRGAVDTEEGSLAALGMTAFWSTLRVQQNCHPERSKDLLKPRPPSS